MILSLMPVSVGKSPSA